MQAQLYGLSSYVDDCVFDRKKLYSYLQVIFRATYLTKFWNLFQKEDGINHLKWSCHLLETVNFEMFAKNGDYHLGSFVFEKTFSL